MPRHEILTAIEQARNDFKRHLDNCPNPDLEPFRELTFAWGFHYLKVTLKYVLLDSPTGFPYSRVTAYMQLNGKKISRKQLEETLPPVLPPLKAQND